jgi:hypothetical protein
VVDAITASGKLLVGHNMMLDLAYSVQQFYGTLSSDLAAGAAAIHAVFPKCAWAGAVLQRR